MMTRIIKCLRQMFAGNTFRERLYLTVLDKVLLGLAICVAGGYLDCKLKEFESRKVFEQAVSLKRIDSVKTLWPCINSFESLCAGTILILNSVYARNYSNSNEFNKAMETEYNPKADIIRQKSIEVFEEIDKRRFWLAADLHKEFLDLILDWDKLVIACSQRQKEDVSKLTLSIAKHHARVDAWRHKYGMPSSVRSASSIKKSI